jgi:DNA-binding LacI/PurR family transcriptional regulator
MAVKIKDVARAADVSIATVSYVINNSASVSDETRQRVLEAIRILGYRPNSTARNLKASETRLIGYAWHDVKRGQMNAVLDRFLYQMARVAEAQGYHVLTFVQEAADPVRSYENLIHTSRVDGFVLAGTDSNDVRIQRLMAMGFPFVAFGRANDDWDFPCVDVDVQAGIVAVVEHLLALGHRRIACLGWPEGSHNGDERVGGYRRALHNAGITPPAHWIARTLNVINDAAEAAYGLLTLPLDERPTAIVALSDVLAIGAMNCVESLGLRVGEDIAVTGFDDDPMSAFLRPPLTSMHQPIDEVAEQVVTMLMTIISGQPLIDRRVLFEPQLLIRRSSDPYRRSVTLPLVTSYNSPNADPGYQADLIDKTDTQNSVVSC